MSRPVSTVRRKSPRLAPRCGGVQSAIDRLLIAQGAYVPLELLLELDRLSWSDYESWRSGGRSSLAGAFAGEMRETIDLLREAAAWAESLGLEAERQVYFGWGDCADRRLDFCSAGSAEADALLSTHYVPPAARAEAGQLDIFLHSVAVAALESLRAALRARNLPAVEQSLADLASKAPEHRLLPAARQIADGLARLSGVLSFNAAESELRHLESVLEPAARNVLGPDARGLLAPFWRRLVDALAGAPFDPQCPLLHASYAHLRCQNWQGTESAILATTGYADEPLLVARLAEARRRAGDRAGAIEAWCRLCWRFAAVAEPLLNDAEVPDVGLRAAWVRFRDLDLDPPAETALFPAYLLLCEPGLARVLAPELAAADGAGERAFRAVRTLLREDGIEARKAVRSAAPWLLDRFLELRS